MTLDLSLSDDLVDQIKLGCTPVEFLIISKALRMFASNEYIHAEDREIADGDDCRH